MEAQWGRWMRSYWQNRLESVPRRINIEEASSLARWVVYLTQSIEEGVQLALRHPAGFDQHARLLHELSEQRIEHNPFAFTQLVSHLLADTRLPLYSVELPTVVSYLRNHGVDDSHCFPSRNRCFDLAYLWAASRFRRPSLLGITHVHGQPLTSIGGRLVSLVRSRSICSAPALLSRCR